MQHMHFGTFLWWTSIEKIILNLMNMPGNINWSHFFEVHVHCIYDYDMKLLKATFWWRAASSWTSCLKSQNLPSSVKYWSSISDMNKSVSIDHSQLIFLYFHVVTVTPCFFSLVLHVCQSPWFFFLSIMPKPMYPCNKPLVYNGKMCVPPCPWVFFSPTEDYALKVVDNFAIAVSLLSFVIILATWLRIKQL